ncbi:hypothetical protein [Heyndrickxia sporothermodurans]|nr:hypothetical protein [Heyndrickxia sporothermodurans]MED3697012.1 hypothetical protein [Heyndrickxia sporothermodurans]MED3780221.1 hypothetical protein [Heyndrickxia sporothermodurans]
MNRLDEKYFADFKGITEGRLDNDRMLVFNIGTFLYSCVLIGIPILAIFFWNSVGWNQLSPFWQGLFYCEGVLLVLQLFILLVCHRETNLNQKILSLSMVIYGYKMTIDPFVFLGFSALDVGVYEDVKIYLLVILLLGLLLHCIFLYIWIRNIKKGKYALHYNKETKKSRGMKYVIIPIIFAMVTFSILLIRQLPGSETTIILIVAIVLLFVIAYAICEFIIVAYCVLRFPSFSINPPPKQQYVKKKKRRKKKRR